MGIANLPVPKRSVQVGLFKSPNRLRWLAHGVTDLPVSRLGASRGLLP
jgi:hypothetical protein